MISRATSSTDLPVTSIRCQRCLRQTARHRPIRGGFVQRDVSLPGELILLRPLPGAIVADCRGPPPGRTRARRAGPAAFRRLDARHQRHIGRKPTAIGQIQHGGRFHGAGNADQHHFGPLQVGRVLAVVVAESEGHGLDFPGPASPNCSNRPGFSCGVSFKCVASRSRIGPIMSSAPRRAIAIPHHQPAQFVGNQRVQNERIALGGLLHHRSHFLGRPNVRAADKFTGAFSNWINADRAIRSAVPPVASDTT